MRIIIAGILGGIVMFFWSAMSHMMLPLGEVGFKELPNEAAVVASLKANVNEPAIYLFPWVDMSKATPEEQAAWTEKHRAGPQGMLVYHPAGAEPMGARMLLTELASNILACIAAALAISWLICSFFGRVAAAGLIGLAGWLSIIVSLWNWYGFPTNYMLAQGVEQVVGWLLAGIAIALLVKGRGE